MKMPNFRLSETQAIFGALIGVVSVLSLVALAAITFRNFREGRIWYDPQGSGLTGYRRPLIFALTGMTIVLSGIGGMLGFSSLGHKRNNRQGLSWIGLMLGAFCITGAAVCWYAWFRLNEPIISG
jgi:hypothetical protein